MKGPTRTREGDNPRRRKGAPKRRESETNRRELVGSLAQRGLESESLYALVTVGSPYKGTTERISPRIRGQVADPPCPAQL